MTFHKGLGWQNSELTDIQKAYHAPGNEDGGITLDPITVIDELAKSEFIAYFNAADLRQGLLEALARGEVTAQDVALVDTGRIRKSTAEKMGLRPWGDGPGRPKSGGENFRKSALEPVKAAYQAFADDEQRDPMASLKAAAEELDELVRRNG